MELILPPPARLDAGAAQGALPGSTQKALGRLLSACGLSADFSGVPSSLCTCLDLQELGSSWVLQVFWTAHGRQVAQRG